VTVTPELVRKYVAAVTETAATFRGNIPVEAEFRAALGTKLQPVLDLAPDLAEIKVVLPAGQLKAPLTVLFQYDGENHELWKVLMLARVQQLEEQFLHVAGLAAGYRKRIEEYKSLVCIKEGKYAGAFGELAVGRTPDGTVIKHTGPTEMISWYEFDHDGNHITKELRSPPMPAKTYIVNFCDRCDEEVDRVEAMPDGTAPKKAPAFFRMKVSETPEGVKTDEKALDTLCKKCKKDVETLDNRIFSGGRTREPKEGEKPDATPQQ
jgi:hypothetical protein